MPGSAAPAEGAPAAGAPPSGASPPERAGPVPASPPAGPAPGVIPADAVRIDAATGLQAWLLCVRPPRGIASESAVVPGQLQVRLSAATSAALVFRMEADPADAVKFLGREPVVRIGAGRDLGVIGVAGLRVGTAAVTARLDGADPGGGPVLRTTVEVRAHDEFPDPVVIVVAEPPSGADAADVLVTGERRMSALRGAVCGVLRIRRSAFRGHATTPTDVVLVLEDPAGIVEPLPAVVTIPAGAFEPTEPVVVRLRDAEGHATLRARAAGAESVLSIESVTPTWTGPDRVVLPLCRRGRVRLTCRPGTAEAPAWTAAAEDTGVLGVRVAPASAAPLEEGVVVTLEPRAVGDTTVRVRAPRRPEFPLAVAVVPAEIVLREGRPSLLRIPAGAKGTVVLTPTAPARFEPIPEAPTPAGVRIDVSTSGAVTVTVESTDASSDQAARDAELPVRLTGAVPGTRVRVLDRARTPPRAEYDLDAGP